MNWPQSLKIFHTCFPNRWRRESTAIFAGVVNQIALTGTITHLHLWWQQPGRRAKKGWVWVNCGRGPEWIVFHSQKASRGSHSHLNTNYVSLCYNWSQLLLKSEAFLFWGRLCFWLFRSAVFALSTYLVCHFPFSTQFLHQASRERTFWTK